MNSYTALEIEDIVHYVFSNVVSCFSSDDTLFVEKVNNNIRVVYFLKRASVLPSDLTGMELKLSLKTREMWISSLHVAVPFRSKGFGRQLVHAAEEVARVTEFETINVLPILSSQSFWSKMGFRSHRCTARVLSKSMNPRHHDQTLALADRL